MLYILQSEHGDLSQKQWPDEEMFVFFAQSYRFHGQSLTQLCQHNAKVCLCTYHSLSHAQNMTRFTLHITLTLFQAADCANRVDLSRMWSILSQLYGSVTTIPTDPISVVIPISAPVNVGLLTETDTNIPRANTIKDEILPEHVSNIPQTTPNDDVCRPYIDRLLPGLVVGVVSGASTISNDCPWLSSASLDFTVPIIVPSRQPVVVIETKTSSCGPGGCGANVEIDTSKNDWRAEFLAILLDQAADDADVQTCVSVLLVCIATPSLCQYLNNRLLYLLDLLNLFDMCVYICIYLLYDI